MNRAPLFVAATMAVLLGAGSLRTDSLASTAGSSQGWPQSGANPRHTGSIAHPGGISPATASGLHRAYAVRTSGYLQQTPAVVDGIAYAGTHTGRLLAIRTSNGQQLWSRARCDSGEPAGNGSEETSPAVGSGAAFVLGGNGMLTAIHLAAPHDVFACVRIGPNAGWSPTIAGGVVYATSTSRVVAVSATSGSVLWSRRLPTGADPAANVVVHGATAFVAFNMSAGPAFGHVYALRASDGRFRWGVDRPGYIATLAAAHGRLTAAGAATSAWDESTGALLWTSTCHQSDAVTMVGSSVLITGGEAGTCDGAVESLDAATGAVQWRTQLASELEMQASAGGGLAYVTNLDTGVVDLLRLSDGSVVRTLQHTGGYYDQLGTPVVLAGSVYLVSTEGAFSTIDRWKLSR